MIQENNKDTSVWGCWDRAKRIKPKLEDKPKIDTDKPFFTGEINLEAIDEAIRNSELIIL